MQSPMTGILYRLEAKPGGYLNPGDLVAEVDVEAFQAAAYEAAVEDVVDALRGPVGGVGRPARRAPPGVGEAGPPHQLVGAAARLLVAAVVVTG